MTSSLVSNFTKGKIKKNSIQRQFTLLQIMLMKKYEGEMVLRSFGDCNS